MILIKNDDEYSLVGYLRIVICLYFFRRCFFFLSLDFFSFSPSSFSSFFSSSSDVSPPLVEVSFYSSNTSCAYLPLALFFSSSFFSFFLVRQLNIILYMHLIIRHISRFFVHSLTEEHFLFSSSGISTEPSIAVLFT